MESHEPFALESLKTLTENVDPKFLGANWEKVKPTFNAALDKLAQ